MKTLTVTIGAVIAVGLLAVPSSAAFQQGSKILFTRTFSFSPDVASIDTSTKNVKLLVNDSVSHAGEYSPNGKKIVFVSKRNSDTDGELYVANADGSHAHAITNDANIQDWPRWSPDGKWIMYWQNGSPYGFRRIKPDGTGDKPIYTPPSGSVVAPLSVAPNGVRIAFSMNLGGGGSVDVYSVALNGSGLKDLTPISGDEFLGDYSPTGGKIAYTADYGGAKQVFTMNTDGSHPAPLTNDIYNKWFPQYTADGSHIVYAESTSGSTEALFWMKKDGSSVKRLTPDLAGHYDTTAYD